VLRKISNSILLKIWPRKNSPTWPGCEILDLDNEEETMIDSDREEETTKLAIPRSNMGSDDIHTYKISFIRYVQHRDRSGTIEI
jgi:hypothetical protein